MFYVGTKLSTKEWEQLLLAFRIHMLSQICVQTEHWLTNSHDSSINGVYNADIGSLNVWMIMRAWDEIVINDKLIVAALNEFDPYLYLTTLLCWNYQHTYFPESKYVLSYVIVS
ncbi:hypothetical protein L218DRAFT_491573 [Marasmius fiardii PR-910]|nr:hypothetical protein L218DRAFT_491573 [Marasmius fiardii PR-910]